MANNYNFDDLSPSQIASVLDNRVAATYDIPDAIEPDRCRNAAVLIPFIREQNGWHLLFIRRAEYENDQHSGQVAFAGGKQEKEDDNLIATALRETHEEIGIAPQDINVLGQLNHHYSISQYKITPVVATVPWPYQLSLDKTEVMHAFSIPLNWLANPDNYQVSQRRLKSMGVSVPVIYYRKYQRELLWGATARMTLTLIETLKAHGAKI